MNPHWPTPPGRIAALLIGLVCLSLAACAGAKPQANSSVAAERVVTAVTASRQEATTTVSVSVSAPPVPYYAFKEASPLRLVVELPGTGPGEAEPLTVNDGLVTAISRGGAQLKGGAGTRIEIGLAREAAYGVERQEGRLIITLKPAGGTPEAKGAAAPAPAAKKAPEGLRLEASDSAPGSPCRISAVQFRRLPNGKCRLVVATSAKPGYELGRISRDTLLLTLRQATLPTDLARPLDTSQFETVAIDQAVPRQAGADVIISVRFRQVVPYHLLQEANELILEFDSCRAEPNPRISLKPRAAEPSGIQQAAATVPEAGGRTEGRTEGNEALQEQLANRPPERPATPEAENFGLPKPIRVIYPGSQRSFSGQRISLDFQNADIQNVLRLIAEVSGLNIITADDVKGHITMRLARIPWDQALDIVLATSNLAMVRTGNVVRIAPASHFREEQKVADEAAQASLDSERKKEQLVPLITAKLRVNYAKAEKMKDRIQDVVTARGKVSFDERTNTVIVRDVQEGVNTARDLLESLDWPTPQVMIEARIVEATSDFSRDLGVQWGANFQKTYGGIDGTIGVQGQSGVVGQPSGVPFLVSLPATAPFGGIGFTFSKLSGALNIDARLQAAETQNKLRIVSAPRIVTLDNTEAYIQQGEDIPYLSQSVDGISTQFVQTALKLTVTPHITPDGRVRMKIRAEKSEPSATRINGTPGIFRKETQTEVLVNHGETVVLGGILKDTSTENQNRIPFFHSIPGLGWLFKSDSKSSNKQELLIFITPKIVEMEKAKQGV
jgi:type IV pilus assembly protein PilQ